MKRLLIAAAMVALTATAASANPCTGTNIQNCNAGNNQTINSPSQSQYQGQQQGQSSYNSNSNKAYGGAGGSGGQGGAGGNGGSGGNGYGGSATATGGNASATGGNAQQSQSQSSSSQANNQGNQQNVQLNDRLQAPAVSSFIAASGPCTGVSGGGAVSVAGFGLGMSFASLEEDCKKRELLRIGFASGNPQIGATAAQGWLTMYQAEFGGSTGQTQSSATGQAPAAIAPQQTASAALNPSCVGANSHTNWYAANCPTQ